MSSTYGGAGEALYDSYARGREAKMQKECS